MKPISLKRNFVLTLLGNFVYGGAQWLMLVLIAKLGTPEMVGRFALALALTAPVVMLAGLGLRSVLATDATSRFQFGEYLGLRLLMLGGALAVIAGAAVSAGHDRELLLIVLVIGLAKALESVSDLFIGLMQQHERMDLVSMSLIVKGVVSAALFAAGLYLTRSLLWAALGLLVSWTLTLFVIDKENARSSLGGRRLSLRPLWTAPRQRALALLALPLGFSALLASLFVNIPRYCVGTMLGERELGIFAAMAYITIVGVRVITALGESSLPRLAKYHQIRDAAGFRRLMIKILGVGFLIGAGGIAVAVLAGKEMLTLLYKDEYAHRLDVLIWLMVAGAVNYLDIFLGYGMTAARTFVVQPVIALIGALVLAAGCVLLIPARGLAGAAMAVAFCAVTRFVIDAYILRRVLQALPEDSKA